jgi:hypothetical protein
MLFCFSAPKVGFPRFTSGSSYLLVVAEKTGSKPPCKKSFQNMSKNFHFTFMFYCGCGCGFVASATNPQYKAKLLFKE